jgi:hypothetical protein
LIKSVEQHAKADDVLRHGAGGNLPISRKNSEDTGKAKAAGRDCRRISRQAVLKAVGRLESAAAM